MRYDGYDNSPPMLIDGDSQLYYPCYLEQRTTSSTTTDLRFADNKRSAGLGLGLGCATGGMSIRGITHITLPSDFRMISKVHTDTEV